QVDRAGRILGGVHENVSVTGNGEVALSPAIDLIQLVGIADGEELARLPGTGPRRRCAHFDVDDTQILLSCTPSSGLAIPDPSPASRSRSTRRCDERSSDEDFGSPSANGRGTPLKRDPGRKRNGVREARAG